MQEKIYHYSVQITRVIDGDTLVADIDLGFGLFLKSQSIRLARINAPEMKGEEKLQGQQSKEALVNKILGKKIYVKTCKDEREKYGRILAELYLEDGSCVNDWLLAENHARPYKLE